MAVDIEEKRIFPRLKFRNPLRYQIRGAPEVSQTLSDDIGAGGISFSDNKFIAPQSLLMLEFNLLSRILRPIGRVAWSSPLPRSDRYRLGVEFLEFDPREKSYLNDFVAMRMEKL